MANKRKKIDTPQRSLFEVLVEQVSAIRVMAPQTGDRMNFANSREINSVPSGEGAANVGGGLRLALVEAIKGCPLSRWEIAGQMSHLLGQDVSKYSLDAWTAESKDGHRMPAEYLPAFCLATGDNRPLRLLAEMAGLFALPGPDALRSEIRRLEEDAKQINAERRKRELFLKEMEK